MKVRWLLHTNAKSEKNAQVLLNQLRRELLLPVLEVTIEGDRYCGHRISFCLSDPTAGRAEAFYRHLCQAERLANSWTLAAVSASAQGWSTRSRIAGILRLEWQEEI